MNLDTKSTVSEGFEPIFFVQNPLYLPYLHKIELITGNSYHSSIGKYYNDSENIITFACIYKNTLVRYHDNNLEIYGLNHYTIEGIIERFIRRLQWFDRFD
jgi:hypothetical protein